jgi:predicted DNA-binding transcriptional regulator AlpA
MQVTVQQMPLERIIRWTELSHFVPYSAMHVRRLEKLGLFPRRIKLGVGKRAAVGWSFSEVMKWISDRMAAREGAGTQLELPLSAPLSEEMTGNTQ